MAPFLLLEQLLNFLLLLHYIIHLMNLLQMPLVVDYYLLYMLMFIFFFIPLGIASLSVQKPVGTTTAALPFVSKEYMIC